jgi:hypothetical protein
VFLATPWACLMVQPRVNRQLLLLSIFDCDQQDQLAHVVYTMTVILRDHCLPLPHGSHIPITNVQQIVEEDVELTRIQL